jgi:hypothetical protein
VKSALRKRSWHGYYPEFDLNDLTDNNEIKIKNWGEEQRFYFEHLRFNGPIK